MSDFEFAVDLLLSAGGCGGGGGKPPKRRRTARSNAGRRGYHCCRKGRGCRGGPASLIRYVQFEAKFFCGECITDLGYDRIPGAVAQASPNQHATTTSMHFVRAHLDGLLAARGAPGDITARVLEFL